VPGITHRYPDRVLFYTTHNCPVYCRHCTRKRKVADPSSAAAAKQLEEGLAYIESHKELRDVVISGGDPLSNSDDRLEYIISRIRGMEHIEVFRLGTRNLVTLPQRITPEFAQMLKKYHPVFIHTHFNHPKECTREAFDACALLADAGCIINNQMVLLKGVNDDPETVKRLNQLLLMMRVRPYYIFQCDMAQGISHFRTPIETGLKIIEALRGHTSGMATPTFVVDAPGGGGKIALMPDFVVKREGKNGPFETTWANTLITSNRKRRSLALLSFKKLLMVGATSLAVYGCSSMPQPKFEKYSFPKEDTFTGKPKKPFKVLGMVKSRVNFTTLDPNRDEQALCANYFNRAAELLLEYAKDAGGDAVADVRSVTFMMDGRSELYPRAECSDDGGEGQVLAQGVAIKWLTKEEIAEKKAQQAQRAKEHLVPELTPSEDAEPNPAAPTVRDSKSPLGTGRDLRR